MIISDLLFVVTKIFIMKFIKQEIKLTVENVDPPTSFQKHRHVALLPNTIRALIVGPSGCGKTNLIFTLLTNINGIRFHNVYIYSKTLDQPKYKMLGDILSGTDVGLFTFYENEKVLPPEEALPNSVFIFENQKIARTYFSKGRHNLIDVFYISGSELFKST